MDKDEILAEIARYVDDGEYQDSQETMTDLEKCKLQGSVDI